MREAKNSCKIVGLVNSIDVREGTMKESMPYISLKMEIDAGTPGSPNPIKIEAFAGKLKKDGTENKIYKSLMNDVKNYKTVKDNGDRADKVRITSARMKENIFIVEGDREVSHPIFTSNFFNLAGVTDSPEAVFEVEIVVVQKEMEKDSADVLTGRLIVTGLVVEYGDKVSKVNFIVDSHAAIDFFNDKVEIGDTMPIRGNINYSVLTECQTIVPAFGEPITNERTKTTRELIITSGQPPFFSSDSNSYSHDDIKAALDERKTRITKMKEEAKSGDKKAAPATSTGTKESKSRSFGF